MSIQTLRQTLANIRDSGLLGDSLSIVWHLGEPLVAPLCFYEEAFAEIEKWSQAGPIVRQSIQTNGTLLRDEHVKLFKQYGVTVGLSVDGPAFIHDFQRAGRSGKPSFKQTMQGLRLLREGGVSFNVITVLTNATLAHANEMYAFYVENGIPLVGFNIDEIEGSNTGSSFEREGSIDLFRNFITTFYRLVRRGQRLNVREFRGLESLIRSGRRIESNNQNQPFSILSVGVTGDYTTFSPELLDLAGPRAGAYRLGNVYDGSIRDSAGNHQARALFEDVRCGVEMCRRDCSHFCLCGGGAPSNKLFENGTFRSTETLSCRLTIKTLSEVIMDCMEEELGLPVDADS